MPVTVLPTTEHVQHKHGNNAALQDNLRTSIVRNLGVLRHVLLVKSVRVITASGSQTPGTTREGYGILSTPSGIVPCIIINPKRLKVTYTTTMKFKEVAKLVGSGDREHKR